MSGAFDRKFRLTWFATRGSFVKSDLEISLRRFAEMIDETSAPSKDALPFISAYVYGDKRTPRREVDGYRSGGSLRNRDNVLAFTGVFTDYDGEKLSMQDAAKMVRAKDIVAFLYESPSATPEAPRWRAVFPYREQTKSEPDHARYCTYVNGIFGTDDEDTPILDQSFFTVSRGFYFGTVEGRPKVKHLFVKGSRYLDDADAREELDMIALPKVGGAAYHEGGQGDIDPLNIPWEKFSEAVMAVPNEPGNAEHDRDYWLRVGGAIHHQSEGDADGFELFNQWANQWGGSDEDNETAWRTFRSDKGSRVTTGRTILKLARAAGWRGGGEEIDIDEAFDDISEKADNSLDSESGSLAESLYGSILSGDRKPAKEPAEDSDDEDDDPDPPKRKVIEEYNSKFAVVDMQGKTFAMTTKAFGETFSTRRNFDDLHSNDKITIMSGEDAKVVAASKYWWDHKHRRTYDQVVFLPGTDTEAWKPPAYNLWRGFGIEPNPDASCALFLEHVFENICGGKQEQYDYAMGWMAQMVQDPGLKPDTAMVLGGLKGIGKDTVAVYLGKMLRRKNYVNIKHQKHLTGNFNSMHAEALLLHVEDAFWIGDRSAVGILNGLITSPTASIERKGIDTIQQPSVMRLIISSNEAGVVPATEDERRYFVPDCLPTRRGDIAYWTALNREMQGEGPAALLHHLMSMDLSDFEPRNVPNTIGLGRQKIENLKGVDRFIYEMLSEGELPAPPGLEQFEEDSWSNGPIYPSKNYLYDRFKDWWRDHRYQGELPAREALGRALARLIPSVSANAKTPRKNGDQLKAYKLPPLPVCREEFARAMKSEIEWSETIDSVV